jgi:putative tricarboxylic transport membrane protein
MRNRALVADRVAGGLFMLLGVVSLAEAWRLRPLRMGEVVGDDTFPTLLGLGFLLLGALLVFVIKPQEMKVSWPKGKTAVQMLEAAVAMVVYWLVLPYLGYAISTLLAGAALFYSVGRYRWYMCLLGGGLVALTLHYIFVGWLRMPFPVGVFGF